MGKQMGKHSYRLAISNYKERERKKKENRKQKYLIQKKTQNIAML